MAKKSGMISNAALGALTQGGPRPQEAPYVAKEFIPYIDPLANKMVNSTVLQPKFTGLARSVICVNNQGFNNFQIATLYLEEGVVVKMELSDMWANFETIAVLDHVCHLSILHLNDHFEHGKALQK